MKLKFEDIDTKIFENYRRVIIFSDDDVGFEDVETKNVRYFLSHEVDNVVSDYMKLFSIFEKKLPYLFIFDFSYKNKMFLDNAHYIQIL